MFFLSTFEEWNGEKGVSGKGLFIQNGDWKTKKTLYSALAKGLRNILAQVRSRFVQKWGCIFGTRKNIKNAFFSHFLCGFVLPSALYFHQICIMSVTLLWCFYYAYIYILYTICYAYTPYIYMYVLMYACIYAWVCINFYFTFRVFGYTIVRQLISNQNKTYR